MRIAHTRAHDVADMNIQPGDDMPIPADPEPPPEPDTEKPEGDVDDLPRPVDLAGGPTL
jgi:hypothetical protein